jgi:hypothetical protein
MNKHGLNDSGKRMIFKSGYVREPSDGKGRYDLISPIALEALAVHYERGSKKYSERNWEKGGPLSRFMDSAIRHLNKYMKGMRDEDHLSACCWNCFCVIHLEEMIRLGKLPNDLNDLPNYMEVENATKPKKRRTGRQRKN